MGGVWCVPVYPIHIRLFSYGGYGMILKIEIDNEGNLDWSENRDVMSYHVSDINDIAFQVNSLASTIKAEIEEGLIQVKEDNESIED